MSRNWIYRLVVAAVLVALERADVLASSALKSDFNGDGFADVAIGVPREDYANADGGAVYVIYGGTFATQVLRQGLDGVPDTTEAGDFFGYALAAGDFDADGYADLAVGVPYEDVGSVSNAGAVAVLYGSSGGLTTAASNFWRQGMGCLYAGIIEGQLGANDRFGFELASGDFDGDSYDDLAVGVPDETVDAGNVWYAGAVNVIYGTSVGLNCMGDQLWHQGSSGVSGGPEWADGFGGSLAAGDFDGDSYADLAIGVPYEDVNVDGAGAVNVIRGSGSGLIGAGDPAFHQDHGSIQGTVGFGDFFGYALAVGRFNADSYDDLAIGIPYDDHPGYTNAGSVIILFGSASGLTDSGNQLWSQFTLGEIHAGEAFGWSLAAGDFGRGAYDDLAIGIRWDEVNGISSAGSVNVMYGTANGLTLSADQVFNQATAGIAGGPEQGDLFGSAVTVGDFDGDGYSDLATAAPNEDYGLVDVGVVHIIYASGNGWGLTGSGSLMLDSTMFYPYPKQGDQLGMSLGR